MAPINDPFPTTKLTVPYLAEVLELLRDPNAKRLIVICHAKSPEEGEWILATTAARMSRNGVKVVGPESTAVVSLMELALREKADVALVSGIHTPQDAQALRTASGMGLRIAGVVCAPSVDEFKAMLKALGPWTGYNLSPLTRTPLPPR